MSTYDTAYAKYLRTRDRREKKRLRNIQWRKDHPQEKGAVFAWPPARSNTPEVEAGWRHETTSSCSVPDFVTLRVRN